MLGMIFALALTATSAPAHQVEITHRGVPHAVTYRADTDISMRQIGMSAGTRMSSERCLWSAQVNVVRHVEGPQGATLTHRLDHGKVLHGSHHGACATNDARIRAAVGHRADDVSGHLAEVAQRDRPQLLRDLGAAQAFASN